MKTVNLISIELVQEDLPYDEAIESTLNIEELDIVFMELMIV